MPDAVGWLRGALIVARRDVKENLQEARMWIVTLFILLGSLGPAFGLSQLLLPTGPGVTTAYVVWLLGIVVPVLAVVVSCDSISRERATGSLELLLARPLTRVGLAVGKFLGSLLSVALPLFFVVVSAGLAIRAISGAWPDPFFVVVLFLGTLALAALYALLGEFFSVVSRTGGGALLAAALTWFLFAFVWAPAILGVAATFHVDGSSPFSGVLASMANVFSPNALYNLTVLAFLPSSQGTGPGSSIAVPGWAGLAAWLSWFGALMALVIVAVRRRIA
jgi:Cu-processing system permease protein